ncbi:hypothetical protein IKS57_00630 [bacterium]|nr:hypothetical protein [bacterium]
MQIPGVKLSYNGITLVSKTASTSSNTFTITGFKKLIAILSCYVTSSSPYIYNSEESKLVV